MRRLAAALLVLLGCDGRSVVARDDVPADFAPRRDDVLVAPDIVAADVVTADVAEVAIVPVDVAPRDDVTLAPDVPQRPMLPPGLSLIGNGDLTGLAHSREIALDGDYVWLADANGLPLLRTHTGGRLERLRGIQAQPMRDYHCSTLSLHAPSRTLICGAGDTGIIDFVNVRAPMAPVSRTWSINEHTERGTPPIYEIADVEVSGDTLWIAAQRNGLLRLPLGADGMPTALVRTRIGEDVNNVIAAGGRLTLTDRARGLSVLSESGLSVLASTALDGPPTDLAVQGDRIAVTLGSEGVRVYTLAGSSLTLTASLQPRCVTTGVALSGDLVAVTCLSGVTLYDIARTPARVEGYFPAQFGMLDVAFGPNGLLVSDWFRVAQFSAQRGGATQFPEAPMTLRLMPGADAMITVRNPLDAPWRVSWRLARGPERAVREGVLELPAMGDVTLRIPYGDAAAAGSLTNAADVTFYRADASPEAIAAAPRTRIWHRAGGDAPARGMVAVGDRFPTLRRTSRSSAPDTLPAAGSATLVMFLTPDCYLQWPQLEDMAWARAHARAHPTPLVMFLTTRDEDPFDPSVFMVPRGAGNVPTWEWADYMRAVPGLEGATNPVSAFESSFILSTPGADFPHDYLIGADGVVTETSRMYRGRWNLR